MKKLWARFKLWFLGLLASLGLITVAVMAVDTQFTYTPAVAYEDGTFMPLGEIAETRLYCKTETNDYTLVASEAGADGTFAVDLAPGTWTCVATHVATNSIESAFSNAVVRTVLPTVGPRPPELLP